MDSHRPQRSISFSQSHSDTPHSPRVGVPTRLLDALGCPPSAAGGQGVTRFPRSPTSRSRVNLRVIRPLTRGPQGQPSPLRTPHSRPGVQGIFRTSCGQAPHGWPMVHHYMATGFPIPRGCCLALLVSHPIPCPVRLCHILSLAQSQRPVVSLSQGAVVRPVPHPYLSPGPHPIPHPLFIPHQAVSNPVARAHRILIHPGTVSCSLHGWLLFNPLLPCTQRILLRMFLSGASGHLSQVLAPLAYLCIGTGTQRLQAAVAQQGRHYTYPH